MNRRRFVAGSAAMISALGHRWSVTPAVAQQKSQPKSDGKPFDGQVVRRLAQELARRPFKKPDRSVPKEVRDLGYDNYRRIRFRPDLALWRDAGLPFQVQLFHRGFIFLDRVDIFQVDDGQARPISYSPQLFDFDGQQPPPEGANVGFAGFRIHAPINRPDYYDEVGVFLGASYFRAVAKGQEYGLSARGLSLRTGDPKGEEFPAFRAFWLEKPRKNTSSMVVHALLDSESASAAFRFTVRPGATTVFDVEMTLYPRADLSQAGIGPLTSMFLFDANDRVGVDDFRPAVHDSDGLSIRNGRDEDLWRPLSNPRDLQVSVFGDANPRGFGLFQRERDFFAYQDLESRFEKRPSLWVEPVGDWGEGAVQLVEIPTKEEIHDNIVAFWRPRQALRAKGEYTYTYRLHWGSGKPNPKPVPRFVKTRIGAGPDGSRRFVLEVVGGAVSSLPNSVRAKVSADKGEIRNLVTQPNPRTGGLRIGFELHPKNEPVVELRAQLTMGDTPAPEVWIYRWTP